MLKVTDIDWIEEEKIPDRLLLFARSLPEISNILERCIHDSTRRILLGVETQEPFHSDSLLQDIRIAQAWVSAGNELDLHFVQRLEERSKQDPALHVDAARLHVLSSSERELEARMALSHQNIPYTFPGDLSPLHIEMFAVGDRALHVLHVEWLKKLSVLAIDALELDCQHTAAWLFPFLEVLPERGLIKQIKKLGRKKKLQGGGIGLLAFYAFKMGMNVEQLLEKGTIYDKLFYWTATESEKHRLA